MAVFNLQSPYYPFGPFKLKDDKYGNNFILIGFNNKEICIDIYHYLPLINLHIV